MSKLIRVSDETHDNLVWLADNAKRTLGKQIEWMSYRERMERQSFGVKDENTQDTTAPKETVVEDNADWGA